MIGAFGNVVFVATAETLRTFTEFERSAAGRWAKHERVGLKPLSQFIGPDLDTISFTMRFDVSYGMNPRKEMEALLEFQRSGSVAPLVIGGKALGVDKWAITTLRQSWDVVDNLGNLLVGTAAISLEEYVEEAGF